MVFGVLGLLISKNVIPVVSGERAAVFPLRIADALVGNDLDPATLADGLAGAGAVALEPGNDAGSFRLVGLVIDAVVVGEGDVKWVEPWRESFGDVAAPGCGIGVVVAAIVLLPILVPGGLIVRGRVFGSGFFTDPKDSGGDEFLPVVLGFLVFEGIWRRGHDGHLWSCLGGSRDDD